MLLGPVARAQSVWVAPSTYKVHPTDAAGSGTTVSLEAAGNEFEAFHVVVSGGASGAKAISVSAGTLAGPGGASISDVRVYREGWYNVVTPSYSNTAAGRWPDAMIPAVDEIDNQTRNAFPYDVPANEQQPIFVEYHVPPKATPGWYAGTVNVSGGASATVSVKLYVHAFSLPSTASIRTAFGMGWDDPCIAHYGSYTACGGDAGVLTMMAKYVRFALDHRVSISDAVYAGPTQNSDGSYDWADWDPTYASLMNGNNGRLAGAKLTALRYPWTVDQAHYNAWASHFAGNGWMDRVFDYTCDEPPNGCAWSAIAPRAAMAHAAVPSIETIVTTTIDQASANGVLGAIDTLIPTVNLLDPQPPSANTRASYDTWLSQAAAHRVWMYQSCNSHGCAPGTALATGWPSYMIDAPATLNRAMEWQSWRERVSGELYYDTTYAFTTGDPWSSQYYFAGNGDGTLFYPGTPAKIGGTSQIPIASLRLKLIREGQEDFEYLKLLADAGDPTMADTEAAGLSPHAYDNVADAAAVDAARHRIALRIEQLTGATPPPMGPTTSNVPDGGAGDGGLIMVPTANADGGTGMTGVGGNGAVQSDGNGNGDTVGTASANGIAAGSSNALNAGGHSGCSLGGHAANAWPATLALGLGLALLLLRRRRHVA